MGSKKNKVRKVFAPTSPPTTDANANSINDNPTTNNNNDDDDDEHLVDDLLTQLDSRDQSVRRESATVLEEVRARQAAQASPSDKAGGNGNGNSSGKVRFMARQVRSRFATPRSRDDDMLILKARKAAALAEQQPPIDTDADAKLEREAKEEERAINKMCNELGLEMHEVMCSLPSPRPIVMPTPAPQHTYHRSTRLFFSLSPIPHARADCSRRPLSLLRGR
jgi:OTU domain-containing protein 6